jgi:cyclopropane-fatty-acyl-phospholipid synthase
MPTLSPAVGDGGSSIAAVRSHYDHTLTQDFWPLWLDRTLSYSCALWEPGDTLDDAQQRKLDYLATEANAGEAKRVLDIGCGWGGNINNLATRYGVEHVTGLTLSAEQADFIAKTYDSPALDVRIQAWEEFEPDEPYDAIISIGAFEHFSLIGMSRAEKIERFRAFFSKCRSWLRPDGRLSLQSMIKGAEAPDRQGLEDFRYIMFEMFPETDTPYMSEILAACEGTFEVLRIRNDTDHYQKTCAEWLRRFEANEKAIKEGVGDEVYEQYHRYLAASARQFQTRIGGLARLSLRRSTRALPAYTRTGASENG